jgi:hypothetical protein
MVQADSNYYKINKISNSKIIINNSINSIERAKLDQFTIDWILVSVTLLSFHIRDNSRKGFLIRFLRALRREFEI